MPAPRPATTVTIAGIRNPSHRRTFERVVLLKSARAAEQTLSGANRGLRAGAAYAVYDIETTRGIAGSVCCRNTAGAASAASACTEPDGLITVEMDPIRAVQLATQAEEPARHPFV